MTRAKMPGTNRESDRRGAMSSAISRKHHLHLIAQAAKATCSTGARRDRVLRTTAGERETDERTNRASPRIAAALVARRRRLRLRDAAKKKRTTINVVSSPAEVRLGGDARIEVAVPDKMPLGDVDVTLNGATSPPAFGRTRRATTSSRASSPACRSARARSSRAVTRRRKGNKYYDELEL